MEDFEYDFEYSEPDPEEVINGLGHQVEELKRQILVAQLNHSCARQTLIAQRNAYLALILHSFGKESAPDLLTRLEKVQAEISKMLGCD